jgi:putative membrane protein
MVRDIVENRDSTARDHLANERTFLAWVRTALGLIGLGVLLERLVAGAAAMLFVSNPNGHRSWLLGLQVIHKTSKS